MHVNVVRHIKLGCVSDMPGVNYYYYLTTKSGKKKVMCIRGTSQLEGFHAHLLHIIPGFHMSPCLVTCLLTFFFSVGILTGRYNICSKGRHI
jgi:hypothetical protein